jgi:hypothetical protein
MKSPERQRLEALFDELPAVVPSVTPVRVRKPRKRAPADDPFALLPMPKLVDNNGQITRRARAWYKRVNAIGANIKEKHMQTTTEMLRPAAEFATNLYFRWQDEHEYEDFAEYRAAMARNIPQGAEILRMTSRPFVVTISIGGERWFIRVIGKRTTWGKS